jgi:hypothetical protein
MRNELDTRDPLIARLFASQENEVGSSEFLEQLRSRLEREQRNHRLLVLGSIVALCVLTMLVAFVFMQPISIVGNLLTSSLDAIGIALQSPLVWVVGSALAVAALPIVYVWRGKFGISIGQVSFLHFS